MKSEYLIFNMIVVLMPFAARLVFKRMRLPRLIPTMLAICITAAVFIPLDIVMAQRFWSYNDMFVMGIRIHGLPIEELLFFFSVPLACLCVWENIKAIRYGAMHLKHGPLYAAILSVGFPMALYAVTGKPYPAVMAILCSVLVGTDHSIDNGVIRTRAFALFICVISVLTLVFNGYLTARPIVLYNDSYISGLRIYTIPVEDFVFGWAMVTLTVGAYEPVKKGILPAKRSEVG